MSRSTSRRKSDAFVLCVLPLGLRAGARAERIVRARALAGPEELRLLEIRWESPRETLLSQALACHVARLGSIAEPGPAVLHRLALADRHALVRELLLASGVADLLVPAACAACGAKLELAFDLKAAKPPDRLGEPLRLSRRRNALTERLVLRLPRPADMEAAHSPAELAAMCAGISPRDAKSWLRAAENSMAMADPLGQIEIHGTCPGRGCEVLAPLDLVAEWLRRVRHRTTRLLQDVHHLALHYHWSEEQILLLPDTRRQAYLDLCFAAPQPVEELHA